MKVFPIGAIIFVKLSLQAFTLCPVTVNAILLAHCGPTPLPVSAVHVAIYCPRGRAAPVVRVY